MIHRLVPAITTILAEEAKPRFGETNSVVELRGIEFVPRYQVELTGR